MLIAIATMLAGTIPAAGDSHTEPEESFNRISTFSVYTNNDDPGNETVAEIVAVTPDGNTLVYTDGELEQIGLVDITDPANPTAAGGIPVGGEPTSVDTYLGYAVVAVNTSESFTNPSGNLVVIDIDTETTVASLPLAGQPDSIKVSPSGDYLAIVIENERDEDLGDGGIPQSPPGLLQVVALDGAPTDWSVSDVPLTGLADIYVPEDPEPEFVDINDDDIAAVSLQENNALVLVDLKSLLIIGAFDLGTVDLHGIDTVEDDVISLDGSLTGLQREPDAIAWAGDGLIATANEGDLRGGSRGFSVFSSTGDLVFDSGIDFEYQAVRHGHYPEGRSENKGSEPEGIAFDVFGDTSYLFVGSERGSFIGVYSVGEDGMATARQVLPGPLKPEGLLAIPDRNLLVASGEDDDPTFGVRSTIQIYELSNDSPSYPHIISADDEAGKPIPWSALSGLAADPADPDTLYAVWDSFYAESVIFTIDVSTDPAVITEATPITGASGPLDPEGIGLAADGGFWVASEGRVSSSFASTPNLLLRIAADGSVLEEIGLPSAVVDCRQATVDDEGASSAERRSVRYGFEGVTEAANGTVYVAQQREWVFTTPECASLSGSPGVTKIWSYTPTNGTWDDFDYELLPKPANAAWVGLSEITALDDGSFMVIERDNRTGDWAELKTLQRIELRNRGANEVNRISSYDLIPDMEATNGWITDKPEGAAVTGDGHLYVVTDNDGVDDWSGETLFLRLGPLDEALAPGGGVGAPPANVPPASPPGLGCAPGCGHDGMPPGLIGNDNGTKRGVPFAD